MRRLGTLAAALCLALIAALPAAAQELVITFGGDVNFAQSRSVPRPDSVSKFGRFPLAHTTSFLAQEFTGDINFVNVETVVSDRDGAMQGKTFVFRSHPDSFRYLMDLGVNAFSLANNHAYDHGWQGMADTLGFFTAEDRADRPLLFAGIGQGAAAVAPRVVEVGGVTVAMSAIGIGAEGFVAGPDRIGMAMLRVPGQYQAVLDGLAAVDADIRILSVHTGTENQIALDYGQREMLRRAVDEAGVNLVIGHHPHVVRAVEADPAGGSAIFHSLGNLLFVGGAVRDGLPVGNDYGLLGKAYFHITPAGVRLSAIEAVPLRAVHLSPEPMAPWRLRATLEHLGSISRAAAGPAGVAFTPVGGDRGAACFGGPYGPAAQALCCRVTHIAACDFPDLM